MSSFGTLIRHRISINASWLFALQAASALAPLVTVPHLTRTLQVSEFGAVMVALSAVNTAYVLTDFGFSLSATYTIARGSRQSAVAQAVVKGIFTAKVPLVIGALLLIYGLSLWPTYLPFQNVFFASLLAVAAQAYQPVWLYQGLERMGKYVCYMVATRIVYVVLVYSSVRGEGDGVLVLWAWSAANLIGLCIAIVMMWRDGIKPSFGSIVEGVAELKRSSQFFWSRIAAAIYTSAAGITVGLAGLHQAALYSSAEQVYKAGQAVTSPIIQALFPHLASTRDVRLYVKLLPVASVVLMVVGTAVALFAAELSEFLFGVSYAETTSVVSIFAIVIVINFLAVALGYPAFGALGKPQIANHTVIAGAILHVAIVAALYWAGYVSAASIALSIGVTEFFVMSARGVLFIRLLRRSIVDRVTP